MNAAVAQAAHDTLVDLFPAQTITFDALLAEDLSKIRDGRAKTDGIELGQRAATAILALRANDGSQHEEELCGDGYVPTARLGKWRQDPISEIPPDSGQSIPGSASACPQHPGLRGGVQ